MSTTEPVKGSSGRSLPETIGERLSRARRYAKIDQDEMASALGISRSLVTKLENDAREPRLAYLTAWARRCGVDEHWLLTGDPSGPGDSDDLRSRWSADEALTAC